MAATKEAEQPTMKAWRVHEFGTPEKMLFETIPGRLRPRAKSLSKFMRRALVPGMRGSEPEGVHHPSLFLSRSGRTWPVRLWLWVQMFLIWLWEIMFSE